jgi:hypothetical protein
MDDRLYNPQRPEDELDKSLHVGEVRVDCFHDGRSNFDLQQRAFEGGRRVKWSTQGSDGIPKQTAKRATQAVCRISPAALLDTLQKL